MSSAFVKESENEQLKDIAPLQIGNIDAADRLIGPAKFFHRNLQLF
ncbi:hypothetical protein [Mucilaginibacter pallidiroseus]|nr:hypothetical protein [Mucilaginibacter pallidiroseus]